MRLGITPLEEGLGHDHYTLPRDIVLLDEFTEDSLGVTLRVGIGGIECLRLSSIFIVYVLISYSH